MPFCSACAIARVRLFPQAGDHLVPGERGKGKRLHKLLRRRGHHHVHFDGLALQRAHQFRRLVRGDSAGDAHRHSHVSIVVQIGAVETRRARVDSPDLSRHAQTQLTEHAQIPCDSLALRSAEH